MKACFRNVRAVSGPPDGYFPRHLFHICIYGGHWSYRACAGLATSPYHRYAGIPPYLIPAPSSK